MMMRASTSNRAKARKSGQSGQSAFTLVELLPAMTIAIVLIVLLARMVQLASFAWTHGDDQAETYTTARASVDLMSRDIQGAVVDLDFGFRLKNLTGAAATSGSTHNYSLTFLTHCTPASETGTAASTGTNSNPNSVMKVCYQLGWADTTLFPKIEASYSASNPIPVLVRTTSTYLDDVFEVAATSGSSDPGKWTDEFANISTKELVTGTVNSEGQPASISDQEGVTEVIAENVLGMEIHPLYWDPTQTPPMEISTPSMSDSNSQIFYNDYLTSVNGPRAMTIQFAMVPTRSVGILSNLTGWGEVFGQPDLFAILDPANATKTDTFHAQLRHNIHYFSSTIYLQSKTP
jgi:hypothetical protein